MIYSELKDEILSLGFEELGVLNEVAYQKYFRDGINRALRLISVDFPIIRQYPISLTGSGEEFNLADESDFAYFIEAKIWKEVEGTIKLVPFADFTLLQNSMIYINPGAEGEAIFLYATKITPITTSTTDNTVITVDYNAEPLVALLASYYIWKDDASEIASTWYNDYEDKRNLIQARTPKHNPYTFSGGL